MCSEAKSRRMTGSKSQHIIYKFSLVILVLSIISLSLGAKGCPGETCQNPWGLPPGCDIFSGSSGRMGMIVDGIIELDGTYAGPCACGLKILSANNVAILGFTITNFYIGTYASGGNGGEFSGNTEGFAYDPVRNGPVIAVTNTNDSGPGGLRQAIIEANNHSGPDTIVFNIPKTDPGYQQENGIFWWRIQPLSELPAITDDATTIVGTNQYQKPDIIRADEPSIIDTSEDETQPDCEVSVPAGAVTTDTEVSLTSFHMECIDCVNACSNTVTALHSNLPAPLPEGYTLLGGGNLKPIKPDKVNFTPGKEADSYVILPSSVQAEELSTADIRLMEYIDGHWVIVLPNKKGKVITTGPKAGYIGPDESAPAKLTGARPWCWVKVTTSGDTTQSTEVGWAQVAAGWTHTIALKTNGTLWAWGYNYFGQLGLGDSGSRTEINTPTQIGIDTDWAEVIPGAYYTIALKTNGTLWAWGDNTSGQLGLGGTTGCNYYGQSGPLGDTTHRTLPTQIGTGSDWVVVAAGWYYTIALKRNGTLWAWGYNEYGQLGLRDTMDRNTPTQIGTDTDWAAIACENGHAFALKTDGTLWAWGNNGHGQLGLGHTADKNTPTQIGTDTNWVAVAAGYGHTIALKTDGTLWAWGWNLYSQLGLGDTIERHSPVQVGTDTNWVAVACGYDYTIALKTNGTLWTLRIVITRVE